MIKTFSAPGQWFKGNLHAHTNLSDGITAPKELVARYKALGYSFIVLSDHRVYRRHDELCEDTFITLPGMELDASFNDRLGKHYHHIVGVGITQLPEGFRCDTEGDDAQKATQGHIDWLRETGMQPIYCHAHWSMATMSEVADLNGFDMIEVYNNLCQHQDDSGDSEAWWDHLLWSGRRVLGVASDDTHQKIDDIGGGFIMVKAPELTREAILSALHAGSFYASQGPVISDIQKEGNTIYVRTSAAKSVAFVCYPFRGYRVDSKGASVTEAFWNAPDGTRYVRIVVTDREGRKAWSQPIYCEED